MLPKTKQFNWFRVRQSQTIYCDFRIFKKVSPARKHYMCPTIIQYLVFKKHTQQNFLYLHLLAVGIDKVILWLNTTLNFRGLKQRILIASTCYMSSTGQLGTLTVLSLLKKPLNDHHLEYHWPQFINRKETAWWIWHSLIQPPSGNGPCFFCSLFTDQRKFHYHL